MTVALAYTAGLLFGGSALSAGLPSPKTVIVDKGKLATDGLLTVGQQETVSVKGLPGKMRLKAFVSPPRSDTKCYDFKRGFCPPVQVNSVPGTAGFKTDAKGLATLTFVMADSYYFIRFKDPETPENIAFADGQTIRVFASGTQRRGHRHSAKVLDGYAPGNALVEVEPPMAAP